MKKWNNGYNREKPGKFLFKLGVGKGLVSVIQNPKAVKDCSLWQQSEKPKTSILSMSLAVCHKWPL